MADVPLQAADFCNKTSSRALFPSSLGDILGRDAARLAAEVHG